MRRAILGLLFAVLSATAASGCARAPIADPDGQAPSEQPSPTQVYEGCPADAPAVTRAKAIVLVDLDGDGTSATVDLVSAGRGPCGTGLVLRRPAGATGVKLDAPLDPSTVQIVDLLGTDRQLLMVSGPGHPRGGFAVHLFGADDAGITEVTLPSGEPVLPFVATDGGGLPVTATCESDGQIAVVSAVPHKPPGIVLDWDVTTTTYTLDAGTASVKSRSTTEPPVIDPTLRRQMPQLFDPGAYFAGCVTRSAG